jgi:hypothetical protein
MLVDLYDVQNLSVSELAELLATKDDSANRQLRVSHSGQLGLYNYDDRPNESDYKFWFAVWCEGNGYSGVAAAADKEYVTRIHYEVCEANKSGSVGLIDY